MAVCEEADKSSRNGKRPPASRAVRRQDAVPDEEHGRFLDIFREPYLTRTLMLIVFNIFQTVGFYGFSNWVPAFLMKQGIAVTASLGYTFVIAIAAPMGPALAGSSPTVSNANG